MILSIGSWSLTEDLVLSDRDQDAAEVLRWLRGEPSLLSLQATAEIATSRQPVRTAVVHFNQSRKIRSK